MRKCWLFMMVIHHLILHFIKAFLLIWPSETSNRRPNGDASPGSFPGPVQSSTLILRATADLSKSPSGHVLAPHVSLPFKVQWWLHICQVLTMGHKVSYHSNRTKVQSFQTDKGDDDALNSSHGVLRRAHANTPALSGGQCAGYISHQTILPARCFQQWPLNRSSESK